METDPGAKASVPVGILLGSVPELSGRPSRYLQAELFAHDCDGKWQHASRDIGP